MQSLLHSLLPAIKLAVGSALAEQNKAKDGMELGGLYRLKLVKQQGSGDDIKYNELIKDMKFTDLEFLNLQERQDMKLLTGGDLDGDGNATQTARAGLLSRHTYAFGLVDRSTNDTNAVAPLATLLNAPAVALTVNATRDPAGHISLSVGASGGAAHFVKLSLRDADGQQLPFVSFSSNLQTLLDDETMAATAIPRRLDAAPATCAVGSGCVACAEAWNARLVCNCV